MPHHPWAAPHNQDGEDQDDVDEDEDEDEDDGEGDDDEDDQRNQKHEKEKCWKTFISHHPALPLSPPSPLVLSLEALNIRFP